MSINRRAFLTTAVSAAAAVSSARLLSAGATTAPAGESLVRLLIGADRDRLLEQLAARIRAGLDYRTLLGSVVEAAAREVRPYPYVGFKYHAFMVLHAVHLTTLHGRPEDRWLPVLWAADVLKASQAEEMRQGDWSLGPVREHLVPPAGKAERAFQHAMEQWDTEAADAAIVGLLATHPRDRLFDLLFGFGARDFRSIGHKAITVANCHRLLRVVSAEHAEPMLRSLVLALQNHEDEPNPATSDLVPDRPWRRNLALLHRPRATIRGTHAAEDSMTAMLHALREGSDEEASAAALASLDRGVPEDDIWTLIFAAAGDLMLKQSGIISVHANTTSNALRYAWRHASDPATRRMLLLQAAAFLPLFRDLLGPDHRRLGIDTIGTSGNSEDPVSDLKEIFAAISADRIGAAGKTLAYLRSGGAEVPFMTLARHYTVDRNVGYHDYKFTEAAFENAAAMDTPWRQPYLASSVLYLNGSADAPNETVARARELLQSSPAALRRQQD